MYTLVWTNDVDGPNQLFGNGETIRKFYIYLEYYVKNKAINGGMDYKTTVFCYDKGNLIHPLTFSSINKPIILDGLS